MNDFQVTLSAIIDSSSLSNIEKQLAKEKLKINAEISVEDFAKSKQNIEKQISDLASKMKSILGDSVSDQQATKWAKQYYDQMISGAKQAAKEQETVYQNAYKELKKLYDLKKEYAKISNPTKDEEYYYSNSIKNQEAKYKSAKSNTSTIENYDYNKRMELERQELKLQNELALAYDKVSNSRSKADQVSSIQKSLDIGDYETKILSYQTALEKLGLSTSEIKEKMQGVNIAYDQLKQSADGTDIIPDNVITNAEKLNTEFSKLSNVQKQLNLKDSLQADDLKVTDTITRLNEQLRKNSAYSSDAKAQIRAWIAELESGNVAESRLKQINSEAKKLHSNMANLGKIGFSWTDKLKQGMQSFSTWVSATTVVMTTFRSLKEAAGNVKELDDALTNISYTMDVTDSQLEKIGNSSLQMAEDLKTSASNVLGAVKLYANAKETADSIIQKARPAIMLSNVTGMTGEDSAKMLQSIMNQFDMTQDDLMGIADIIESVSQNMAYDFSSGINEIAAGIERSGSVAKSAGLNLQEYSSMLGLVIEQTGQGGDTVGNAFKTIFQRITKASATEGTLEEDISDAEEALRAVGVEVRDTEDEFRDLTDIMSDLGKVWNNLSSVEQSNISYNIAGIRQTNILKSLLSNWEQYESLVEKAENSSGTTLQNQEVYAESLSGKLGELSAIWEKIGDDAINSSWLKVLADVGITVSSLIDKFGLLNTAVAGIGGFLGAKNLG